jgi:hypothetical protein
VPMASTIQLSNNKYHKVEDANHLTICKPPTKDHLNYSKLLECLKKNMKVNNVTSFNFWNFVCLYNLIANIHYYISWFLC